MATSKIPNAIDGLLALCNAQTGSGGTLVGVAVYDGPPVTDPAEQVQLYIGHDEVRGALGGDLNAVEGDQEQMTMGGARQETFSIRCAAVARSGALVMKTERDRAFAVVAAVENLIRLNQSGSDITLGGAVLASNVVGSITLMQLQTPSGAYVKVTFFVSCLARI